MRLAAVRMQTHQRLLLVAALLVAPPAAAAPKHSHHSTARPAPRATPTPVWHCDWCSSYLTATHEPSLVGDATMDESYRVIYSPSFGHPFVVRIDCTTNDLTAYVFDHEPPAFPDDVVDNSSKVIDSFRAKLKPADCDAVRASIDLAKFWSMPESVSDSGADGYELVLEAHSDSRYHRVVRWEGGPRPFHDAVGKILQLAGINGFGDEPVDP